MTSVGKQIPFGCAKKVPTRAGEGTRPYVAWKKSPPGRVRAPAPTWLGKSPRRFAKSAKGWAPTQDVGATRTAKARAEKGEALSPNNRTCRVSDGMPRSEE